MKEAELRKHADCSFCKQKILAGGIPLFYRLTVERFGIELGAVQRQQGLGMMLNARLAMVMGTDEDMAKPMMDPVILTICEECSTSFDEQHCVAGLADLGS